MNTPQKVLSVSAVGLLLGFGLCGVGFLLPSSRNQEFGGGASFLGFIICVASVLVLFSAFLYMLVAVIIDRFRGNR